MDISEEDRMRFSGTMREVLNEMEPVCQEEQNFITNFFHLTGNLTPIFDFFFVIFRRSKRGSNSHAKYF